MSLDAKPGDTVVCETVHAITTHARVIGPSGPRYGGGADTRALCGSVVAWDTRIPLNMDNVRCRKCRAVLATRTP